MKNLLLVCLGSFFGGGMRYLVALLCSKMSESANVTHGAFPWGTFAVNIAGCLLIGFLSGMAATDYLPPRWKMVLITGFCGGFTTFSTFMNENYLLAKGHTAMLVAYTVASLVLGMAALTAGHKLASMFTSLQG